MQIKDLDELEKSFNNASANLNSIKSLSEILFDCMCRNDYKPQDIQNLTDVLNEKIIELKEKFNSIAQSFMS